MWWKKGRAAAAVGAGAVGEAGAGRAVVGVNARARSKYALTIYDL